MSEIQSVVIAGAGAVGLTVASQLYSCDPHCVRILAGGERLKRYQDQGLYVIGQRIDFDFAPVGAEEGELHAAPADLIIFACKAPHLQTVLSDVKPYVDNNTLMLSLLNGISSEQEIGIVYGAWRLPLAMILGTDAQHSGTETTFTNAGTIHFGEADGTHSERVKKIAALFDKAHIAYEIPPNMLRRLWYKYMINVGINQTSAVLRLPYQPFQTKNGISEARSMMEAAMREVIALAQSEGINLNDKDLHSWYETLDSLDPNSRTSMSQDVAAGRKTEVELFSGTVIRMGKKKKIPVPVNQLLYWQIRTIEQTYIDT